MNPFSGCAFVPPDRIFPTLTSQRVPGLLQAVGGQSCSRGNWGGKQGPRKQAAQLPIHLSVLCVRQWGRGVEKMSGGRRQS